MQDVRTSTIEPRAYGPDASVAEREAIASRVTQIDDRLLLFRELPVQTLFSTEILFDRMEALARDWDRFDYIVDLTDAKRPSAEIRAALKQRIARIRPRIGRVAVVVGRNVAIRAMAKLVGFALGLPELHVYETYDDALREIHRARSH